MPTSLILLVVIIMTMGVARAAQKPPPPTVDDMETVVLEQYVLLRDRGLPPSAISPALLEAVRDISRRHTTGCRTAAHYEMETELFRHLLKSNSLLYRAQNIDLRAFLFRNCSTGSAEPEQQQQQEL